jgi:ABC-type multidrug transport system fused ATPase/permease subunit
VLKEVLNNSISFFKNFTKNFYSIEKIRDLFESTPRITWLDSGKSFEYKTWNIEVKNISFSYWENIVFRDFSLNITWKSRVALVWLSGSWKTTLIKLISGFLRTQSWKILIDGQDIATINLESYYKSIWYLTQEPSIFDWTIYENLTYWIQKNSINSHDLGNVIKLAKCEFIYDLKEWLNTDIWEKWVRLSWWQKQRLAIAKLFLKNPSIIIMDEPTSALDSFSEESISDVFKTLFVWKTVLIVAHRLQTVKSADSILVFDAWKIVEYGNHDALIKTDWYYKRMLELQSGF